MAEAAAPDGPRATRREWVGLAVLALPCLPYSMDLTVLNLAVPALIGVAAATLAPSTLSLLRDMSLDPGERTFAVGVWAASFSAGAAVGPLVGGPLLARFWWGCVFLIAVPVMLLLLALGPVLLPESRDPGAGRLHLASAAMSLAAVLAVVYGAAAALAALAFELTAAVCAATAATGLLAATMPGPARAGG